MNKAWRRMTPIELTGTAAGPMTEPERERYLATETLAGPGPPSPPATHTHRHTTPAHHLGGSAE